MLDTTWMISQKFCKFKEWYSNIYLPSNVGGDFVTIPTGYRRFNINDHESHLTLIHGPKVIFHFRDNPHCVFGNIGNFLYHIGEVKSGKKIIDNIDTSLSLLLSKSDYERCRTNKGFERYYDDKCILCIAGYHTKKMSSTHDILTMDINKYDGAIIIPKMVTRNIDHIICVVEGNPSTIIYGSHTYVIELTKNNLYWCWGEHSFYYGMFNGLFVRKPTKKRQRYNFNIFFGKKIFKKTND